MSMEKNAPPENLENTLLRSIEDEYRKAFKYINKGLSTDETGYKEEARNYYKQGQEHLIRGLNISLQRPEFTGPAWDNARQMQAKMEETLQNVNTRLNILQQSLTSLPSNSAAENASSQMPALYPALPPKEKEKPERPPPPISLVCPSEPCPVNGFSSVPSSETVQPIDPIMGAPTPPAYTPQATEGHYTVSYGTESGELSTVGVEFYSMAAQPPPVQSLGVDAEELILIPQGVQIFFVTADGLVTAPSYPGYLRIIKFMDTNSEVAQNRPPAFLQVCDWLYPLMCTQSPVLRTNTGVYMFPDVMSQLPGSYVGVVLSSELPIADQELFEDLLRQMSDLRIQPSEAASEVIDVSQTVHIITIPEEEEKELPEWSEKVAQGILSGASWISWGLAKGAELTEKAIHKGASKLREHIQPEDKPLEVSPTVAKGLHVAKQATGGAVKVSQFLVDGVCSIASCVGRELAPHVKKHGSKLLPESLKKDKDGKSPLDGAMAVAASGVQGFATVWQGLEFAGKNIAKSVASETVHTIKHKYGKDAGHVTDNAVHSAMNVGATAFNIDNIGIKALVKKTAKETSHAILDEYKINKKQDEKEEKH
ncbi:hypothetical protein XENTR_v10006934 [Xenopus tropicalis]|uniref:Spartin n=1 Tax=Xenopus tropicalis TaxID=8364 RepID=A0A8J1J157_XENTR|nr:spartin isoform X1 [Xenopus tropicalis]KAE8627303.1 hypothetical protein XENTR_v10006934 [Xenopus tropicalis]